MMPMRMMLMVVDAFAMMVLTLIWDDATANHYGCWDTMHLHARQYKHYTQKHRIVACDEMRKKRKIKEKKEKNITECWWFDSLSLLLLLLLIPIEFDTFAPAADVIATTFTIYRITHNVRRVCVIALDRNQDADSPTHYMLAFTRWTHYIQRSAKELYQQRMRPKYKWIAERYFIERWTIPRAHSVVVTTNNIKIKKRTKPERKTSMQCQSVRVQGPI